MKHITVLSASALLALSSCETMNQPLTGGDFDPLMVPGGGIARTSANDSGFRGGDLVRAVMDNTAFFKQQPKGEADADKLLMRGTGMKVIRVAGSYLQVELDVSGEIGFVPAIMVESASATAPVPGMDPGAYQVYPPIPGGGAIPAVDPAGLPPGGAVPVVPDPSLPGAQPVTPGAVPQPVPPIQPGATPAPPAPPVPAGEPAPVPPVQPKETAPAATGTPTPEKPAEKSPEKPAGTP
jgi:hypothetical protein